MAQGHDADYAEEAHREPPQAVTEGEYAVVEARDAMEIRNGGTETGTKPFVLAYDHPDTVGITRAHGRGAQTG